MEMERRLDLLPDLGYEDEPVEHIKIALTSFAFNNSETIQLLKKRGLIIKNEEWDKMAEIDKEINTIKNKNLEAMTTPCSVFMTFENEEGVNRCLNSREAIEDDSELSDLKTWLD